MQHRDDQSTDATPSQSALGDQSPSSTQVCPYCGAPDAVGDRCGVCRGMLDPLSRQRTQNQMGPWFIRDESRPFFPGCSYSAIVSMVRRNAVKPTTPVRGPTTRQFWRLARDTPGLGHLFGRCHNCYAEVAPASSACSSCGAPFQPEGDREHLGLAPVRPLPGDPVLARQAAAGSEPARTESARAGPTHAEPERTEGQATLSPPVTDQKPPAQNRTVGSGLVVGMVLGVVLGLGGLMLIPGVRDGVFGSHHQGAGEPNGSEVASLDTQDGAPREPLSRNRDRTLPDNPEPAESLARPAEHSAEMTPAETEPEPPVLQPNDLTDRGLSGEEKPDRAVQSEFASLMSETEPDVLRAKLQGWAGRGGELEAIALKRLEQLGMGTLTRD